MQSGALGAKSQAHGQDVPRVHVREDSAQGVRAQVDRDATGQRARTRRAAADRGVAGERARAPRSASDERSSEQRDSSAHAASRTIKVDDGRDDVFSQADTEDELGLPSRGRRVLVSSAVLILVAVVVARCWR